MQNDVNFYDMIPDAPDISEAEVEDCKRSDDYRPILFEYYKFVAQLCICCSYVLFESSSWSGKSRRCWEVLVGLLTRCHRLMGANLEFFQHHRYGEVTQITDRCIFETAIKIRWLSLDKTGDGLLRYLEGSLKPDVELETTILKNAQARGSELVIEKRMLASIALHRRLAGFEGVDPATFRSALDMSALLAVIGEKRLAYVAIGKQGSHHIHGSWASLLVAYLEEEDGLLHPRRESLTSHVNQYVLLPLFVLSACRDFVSNCFTDNEETEYLVAVIDEATRQIVEFNQMVVSTDFDQT